MFLINHSLTRGERALQYSAIVLNIEEIKEKITGWNHDSRWWLCACQKRHVKVVISIVLDIKHLNHN